MTTINRATWVDDDGSGMTGTILNNSVLQSHVYDKVDAALATLDAKNTSQDSAIAANVITNPLTVSGVRPTVALAYTGDAAIGRMFRPVPNQAMVSHNLSYDGTTWLLDDTARAGVALQFAIGGGDVNMYYTPAGANPRTPILLMSFTGAANLLQVPSGQIAAGAGFLERARTVPLGEWQTYLLSAATLTAATGTFTLPSGQAGFGFTYSLVGKIGFLNMSLGPFTTSAATAWVRITLPGGVVPLLANANQLGTNYTAALAVNAINVSTAAGLTFYPNVAQTGTFPAGAGLYLNGTIFFALA